MSTMTPHAARTVARAAAALVLIMLSQAILAGPALATPAPKRPHPHRKPWPITLTVQTVPQLSGMKIRLDDQVRVTDGHGQVKFTQEHNFRPHTLQLQDTRKEFTNRRLQFARWAGQRNPDQAFRTTVTGLPMRLNYTVTAAFAVQRPVTVSLVNLQGQPLDPGRASAVTLRSGRAGVISVPSSGRLWLDSVVPVYRNSTIALEDETYSLTNVMVGGTNTVDAGRQKFTPVTTANPVFTTKFFTLRVTAHDLLFKGRSGDSARITYPDGSVHTLPLGSSGRVVVPDLPRGTYEVNVLGGGTALPNELVLSRDTALDLPLATHLDYAAIVAAIALIMAGLLLIGRGRRQLATALRRARPQPPGDDSTHRHNSGPDRTYEPA